MKALVIGALASSRLWTLVFPKADKDVGAPAPHIGARVSRSASGETEHSICGRGRPCSHDCGWGAL